MSSTRRRARATQAIRIVAVALAVAQTPAAQPAARLALELEDYVQMPITGVPAFAFATTWRMTGECAAMAPVRR